MACSAADVAPSVGSGMESFNRAPPHDASAAATTNLDAVPSPLLNDPACLILRAPNLE